MALSEKVVPRGCAVRSLIAAACLAFATTAFAQPSRSDQRAEAERLANSGAYAAALKAFQAIAAANPDDVEARLWIARMHARLGHPEHAADVYRSVLAAQPQNLEALIGLGTSLVALGRLKEAGDALNRAEALSADGPAVLIAQGHLHEAANRTTLALAYYMRAAALDPSNIEARQAADALRALRAHRLEIGYDFQRTPNSTTFFRDVGGDDAHLGTFGVNARASDTVRIFGAVQVQSAFGSDEQRAGGGVEWAITRHTVVRGGLLKGIDTLFLPDTDGFVNATYRGRRAHVSFDVQGAGFDNATLWLFGPGLGVAIGHSAEASIRYYRGRVTTPLSSAVAATDSVALSLDGRISRRARIGIGYTHGIDRLDWLTIERVTFESDTVSLHAGYQLTPFVSIDVGYEYQSRPADVTVHRARATLVYRF